MRNFLRRRYGDIRFELVDALTFGFIVIVGIIMLATPHLQNDWPTKPIINAVYVVFALEILRANQRNPKSAIIYLARVFYCGFVIIFGFVEVATVQLAFVRDYWATDILVSIDLAIFATHPTVAVQSLHTPWLTELMSFFHLAYYSMPFFIAIPMMRDGRRAELVDAAAIAIFTYCVTYFLYFAIAAKNPRHIPSIAALHTPSSGGYWFAALEHWLQGDKGTTPGNVFPSAHASGSIVWALLALRYTKWAGYPAAVIAIGTTSATVYLGFHHAVDPIAGVALAFACYAAADWLTRAYKRHPLMMFVT